MNHVKCLGVGCREPALMPTRLSLAELSGAAERDELELSLCGFHHERLREALADLEARRRLSRLAVDSGLAGEAADD
jgi:hypothetical protein